MTSWASAAPSSGAKARKRACSGGGGGWAKHVAQGLCRSKKVTRTAEGEDLRFAICCCGRSTPLALVAQAKAYRPQRHGAWRAELLKRACRVQQYSGAESRGKKSRG